MKTNQIMKRQFMGFNINQRTEDEYIELASLEVVGNILRNQQGLRHFDASAFIEQKGVKEFVSSLEKKIGVPAVIKGRRGRGHCTWVHPYVMLKVAFAMSPDIEVEVYSWLYDELIKYRDQSGDSYKKMCGALHAKFRNRALFGEFAIESANKIRFACKVVEWNSATEAQLKLRDRIHDTIAIVADVIDDPNAAVKLGIIRALGESRA